MFLLGLGIGVGAPVFWLIGTVWHEDATQRRQHEPLEHDYAFEAAHKHTVRLDEAGFVWPSRCAQCDTALLRLRAHATLLGKLDDPWVDISVDDRFVARQYFPMSVVGEGVLNLSTALHNLARDGQRIGLRGHGMEWGPQGAQLWQFENRSLQGARVLVIAPHPDDAEIASFGLYSHHESYVVTVTAGEAGPMDLEPYAPDEASAYRLKERLRMWDSLAAPRLGNVPPERIVNLGYFDCTVDQMFLHPEQVASSLTLLKTVQPASLRAGSSALLLRATPAVATWASLVDDLAGILVRVRPDIVVTPHPILDVHLDHGFSTIALLEALERVGQTELSLYLYTNHPPDGDQFPAGWGDGVVSVPPTPGVRVKASGVHSFPLDGETQTLKLFVLDAMHDLKRPPPLHGEVPLIKVLKDAVRDEFYGEGARPDENFVRRAARPNELFFVYDVAGAQQLRRDFHKRREAKASEAKH